MRMKSADTRRSSAPPAIQVPRQPPLEMLNWRGGPGMGEQQVETRSVQAAELKAGVKLQPGHLTILVVDGLKGTPVPGAGSRGTAGDKPSGDPGSSAKGGDAKDPAGDPPGGDPGTQDPAKPEPAKPDPENPSDSGQPDPKKPDEPAKPDPDKPKNDPDKPADPEK